MFAHYKAQRGPRPGGISGNHSWWEGSSNWFRCSYCQVLARFSSQSTFSQNVFLNTGRCALCWANQWMTWRGHELGVIPEPKDLDGAQPPTTPDWREIYPDTDDEIQEEDEKNKKKKGGIIGGEGEDGEDGKEDESEDNSDCGFEEDGGEIVGYED